MADLSSSNEAIFIFSLIGGILPALLWLWFWIQEDKLHPEPRSRIMLAFLGGIIAVPLVLPLENFFCTFFQGAACKIALPSIAVLLAWAVIEEVAKYVAVAITALHSKTNDEPIDALEYLITGALGFAAAENTLYILNTFLADGIFQSFVTGNERFIGASLIHLVSSAILGYCIGAEFYKSFPKKILWRVIGLTSAIALHAVFNVFIIYLNGSKTLFVFSFVWVGALAVLLLFEKIKKIKAN